MGFPLQQTVDRIINRNGIGIDSFGRPARNELINWHLQSQDGFPFGAGKLSTQVLFVISIEWQFQCALYASQNGNGHSVLGFMSSAPVVKIEHNVKGNKLKMSNASPLDGA